MEKIKELNEELKSILESLQKAVELYNSLSSKEKLQLVSEVEKKDVSDIFVCVYNDKCVGLFERKFLSSSMNLFGEYYAGMIYIGIDSNYIGLKTIHDGISSVNVWEKTGKAISNYVTNCNMQNDMSFDDMRLIMYNEGQIEPYENGKATSQEILEVLKYAFKYYRLDQTFQYERPR